MASRPESRSEIPTLLVTHSGHKVWPRGYMVAMDLGPEARYKDERCVKYERSPSKVNRVLYLPYCYHYL